MHLLLLSCSRLKRSDLAPCKAIDLYDGPSYRIIRKMKREGAYPPSLDVYIISGKYGLISSEDVIDSYDKEISGDVVAETCARVKLQELLSRGYDKVHVNLGRQYLLHFSDILADCGRSTGRIGEKNGQMREWILSL